MKRFFIVLFLIAPLIISCKKNEEEELICVRIDDLWGYINSKGEMVIPPQFENAMPFSEGLALVQEKDRTYCFINKKGEPVEGLKGFASATSFSEGLAIVVRPYECPVAVNNTGRVIFKMPEAEEVYGFSDGLCLFSSNIGDAPVSHWDGVGEEAVEVVEDVADTVDGFDRSSVKTTDNSFSDKQKKRGIDIRYGFIDKKGEVVISPTYKRATSFSEGFSIVESDEGLYGFIDKKGTQIGELVFADALPFNEGLAAVKDKSSRLWGYIDNTGVFVIQPQFKDCGQFHEGLAYAVAVNYEIKGEGVGGYINNKGVFVIQPRFVMDPMRINSFSEGFAVAADIVEGTMGYVDKKGTLRIRGIYGYPFKGALAAATTEALDGEKYGIIDKKGNFVVNPVFDQILWDFYDVEDSYYGKESPWLIPLHVSSHYVEKRY